MVIGLEVVLADGRVVHTEGKGPRAATGPNLTQLFVGSEGTLGVITEARLRIHPLPPAQERRAFGFTTFAAGLEACRRILRRGATPAVLRLYDETESDRNFEHGDTNVLIVLDEADPDILAATLPGRRRGVLDRGRSASARRRPGRAVARPPQRRLRAGAAVAGRHRRRHGRDLRSVVGAARPLRRRHRRAQGDRRHAGRVGPPVPRLSRRRVPLLHVRRPRARRRRRVAGALLPPGLGHRDRRHPGARRRHQPSPRHRAQPLPLPAPGAGRRIRRAAAVSRRPSTPTASSTPASSASTSPFGPAPWA